MTTETDSTPLVTTEWLAAHLHDPQVRVADVRWYLPTVGKQGRQEYLAGHIPGAVFVDLDTELAGSAERGPGRHPLPAPDAFALAMVRAGIGDDTLVVAYDDAGGAIAARLWWLLRYFGHQRVAVLDGGIARWVTEGRPLEQSPSTPADVNSAGARFTLRPHSDWVVDKVTVQALAGRPDAVVLDARAAERYEGQSEPVDARPGHIPGAHSAPFAGNLGAEGRFLPATTLRRRFEELGVTPGKPVVAYCGSGVTACHNLLALHLAGFPDAKLYEGSWSDWSRDPSLPAATGPEPAGG